MPIAVSREGPYCTGLLLPGERKSVSRWRHAWLPTMVRRVHQSLHHLVADAPWSDEAMLATVRGSVLPGDEGQRASGGVDHRRYRLPPERYALGGGGASVLRAGGQAGECRVAVSLSVRPIMPVSRLPGVYTCRRVGPTTGKDARRPGFGGDQFPNQAGDRARTNSSGGGGRRSPRRRY